MAFVTRVRVQMYRRNGSGVADRRAHTTVLLFKRKLYISGSWPILVLTTALRTLGRPRHADVKNDIKKYERPTTSRKTAIRINFPHTFWVST